MKNIAQPLEEDNLRILQNTLTLFFIIALGVALGGVGYYFSRPGVLPIHQVQVQGQYQFVTQAAIAKTVTPFVSEGFFQVPIEQAQQALEQLPGVKSASVRRIWPETVQVSLVEQTVIGRWSNDQLITDGGLLFTPLTPQLGQSLPLLTAPDQAAIIVVKRYQQFLPLLQSVGLNIQQLQYAPGIGWKIEDQNNSWIILGDTQLLARLALFVRAYPTLIAQNPNQQLVYVDLQYRNGFAVQWKLINKNTHHT